MKDLNIDWGQSDFDIINNKEMLEFHINYWPRKYQHNASSSTNINGNQPNNEQMRGKTKVSLPSTN